MSISNMVVLLVMYLFSVKFLGFLSTQIIIINVNENASAEY